MTTDFHPERRGGDLPSVERLLSLSDNVIAFALTLLVLQVAVPPLSQVADPTSAADLAARLASQTGHLVSYVIAFDVIAAVLAHPPPGLLPRGRLAGQPGVVELRVPGHHHDHAIYQQPAGRILQQSAGG